MASNGRSKGCSGETCIFWRENKVSHTVHSCLSEQERGSLFHLVSSGFSLHRATVIHPNLHSVGLYFKISHSVWHLIFPKKFTVIFEDSLLLYRQATRSVLGLSSCLSCYHFLVGRRGGCPEHVWSTAESPFVPGHVSQDTFENLHYNFVVIGHLVNKLFLYVQVTIFTLKDFIVNCFILQTIS